MYKITNGKYQIWVASDTVWSPLPRGGREWSHVVVVCACHSSCLNYIKCLCKSFKWHILDSVGLWDNIKVISVCHLTTSFIRNLWISNVAKIEKTIRTTRLTSYSLRGSSRFEKWLSSVLTPAQAFLGEIVNPCKPSILGHAEMIHMWMENFGAVGNFLWKKDCALGTDSVPTKANYSAIFVKFPAQTADLTLL